ncbi:MAG: hypothetical protein KGV59_05675, partial [Tenacibaculum sp.]|nr:hypothetical protein [Tenacibaculum sp.]
MPKQTSNIFPDLEESDLYEIEVTGKCGSRIVKISTRNDLLPKIENTYSCRSKTMKLEVKRSFGLDIEWFKNGVSLGKTGKVLTIENYDTTKDNGVYSAQLSYKKIPELGDCINRKIEKDLTNFKEGGNLGDDGKKTYTIDEAKKVGEVDLFTLLKGNDIKTGVWFSKNIELETNLAGSYLNLKELKPGIYEFEFSTGRCLADKKAKVVITIKGKEIILKPDEDTYVIGEPKVVKVLANDPKTVDPTTVLLFPNFNLVDYEKIIMSDDFETLIIIGEGTWIAGVNGEVTFIPEPTFEGDPTPVDYIAKGYDNFGYGEPVSITLKTTPPEPKIKLNKTAPATPVSLGDEITYTFTVENVGDVELTNVTVDDPKLGGVVTLKKTTLAP